MAGKLKNLTRTARTYNLTTKVAPLRRMYPRATQLPDGGAAISDRRVVIPDSITILAGATSPVLEDGVLSCPEIAKAISKRDLLWLEEPKPAPVEAKPAKAKTHDTTEKR